MASLKARKDEGNPDDGIRLLELPEEPTGRGFRMIIITPQQVQWLKDFSRRGISIDDTHNATRYDLKLATVMVMNERDAGVPAGRAPTWASFSNKDAVMDTTMISERWHLRLKTEFLHRNANTRADCLVDLLIKAVEEISQSDEIKVRRRLATSSYRKQQTTKCHRRARRQLASFRLMRQMNDNKWEIYKEHSGELYTVEQHKDCECSDSPEENVHCPLCLVCPYAWSCTCTDNRAGISCIHRHAIMLATQRANRRTAESIQEELQEQGDHGEVVLPSSSAEVSGAQERSEQRSQLRSSINMKISVMQANVNALVNTDTEEAMELLTAINELVSEASRIGLTAIKGIAARPELTHVGGKPKLTRVQLYTRHQSRVTRSAQSHGRPDSDSED
ncbi:hypothetical protein V3C99_010352 [Haemonchus contortus]|uniref:SWIM-type domain-containing protein n=1 Tax=Haemonchus contortus TaxID=6289 RepID=A0A7I4YT23_HAECO